MQAALSMLRDIGRAGGAKILAACFINPPGDGGPMSPIMFGDFFPTQADVGLTKIGGAWPIGSDASAAGFRAGKVRARQARLNLAPMSGVR